MLSGEFQRKIRQLNPRLRIWCGDSDNTPASIFYVKNGEFEQVCGVDKQWLPDRVMFYPDGRIFKGGWKRPLKILIQKKLIDRFAAERVFSTHLPVYAKAVARPTYAPKHSITDSVVKRYITKDEIDWLKKRGN